MVERKKTRQIQLGRVAIGGDAPISLQSMTTTKTADVNATLQQIASLVAAGVDIVRVAVPHWEDAEALKAIAAKSTVPVVADIHFQWKYAMAALEAGIQGLRINPGNIKYQDKVRLIAREAKANLVLVLDVAGIDRKSTRLNSSHITISYAVFCLKKKKRR